METIINVRATETVETRNRQGIQTVYYHFGITQATVDVNGTVNCQYSIFTKDENNGNENNVSYESISFENVTEESAGTLKDVINDVIAPKFLAKLTADSFYGFTTFELVN